MYSTCLYCTKDFGTNDVIETLPIGRRLAFDAAEGRLWVVCKSCAKWNLVPFDSRLESIDACERIFRDTRTRFSTDNIGLARLRDGLELVRIGVALRPEFAAWRYGDRFASRRRRNLIVAGTAGVAVIGALIGIEVFAGSSVMLNVGYQWVFKSYDKFRIATRFVRESGGEPITLSRSDVKKSRLVVVDEDAMTWGISVPARVGVRGNWSRGTRIDDDILLTGTDAVQALGHLLPVIAGTAGSKQQVRTAVDLVEALPTLEAILPRPAIIRDSRGRRRIETDLGRLGKVNAERRLAMEMLANEESERRWLEGELKLLERHWREADRLAVIADRLTVPEEVDEQAKRLSSP